MNGDKLPLIAEAVITDLLAKNSRLEEEIEYLHNEIVSMKTGPYSELLKENRKLRHELAVLVHGVDAESERLRGQLATVTAERDELVKAIERMRVAGGSQEFHIAFELAKDALAKLGADKTGEVEQDLYRCPSCGGPADNGFSRKIPPSPYYCTKCMEKLK